LRSWCEGEGIEVQFRVAEFIKRLDNLDLTKVIRGFDDEESYHLGLFFHKMEYANGQDDTLRRTYRNIHAMLLDGAPRSIHCLWQNRGVTLDCRGQLLYCAPRSPVLGNTLQNSARTLYRDRLAERARIIREYCRDCVHDYPSPPTLREYATLAKVSRWRKRLSLLAALEKARNLSALPRNISGIENCNILITGWYGTETAGDKAVLWEVVRQLRISRPNSRITLSTLYPFVTRRTLNELELSGIELVDAYSGAFPKAARNAGLVVVAGGPLMHIEELGLLLQAFIEARSNHGETWILGCGIGPLQGGERYREAVHHLLRLADKVELRDRASLKAAENLIGRSDMRVVEDPAAGYVRHWMGQQAQDSGGDSFLNCFLRAWPAEYCDKNSAKFDDLSVRIEQETAEIIVFMCENLGLRPRLLPMHHFWVGGDDRDYSIKFADRYLANLQPEIEKRPLSPSQLLGKMRSAPMNLCMRYHSLVFAYTLRVAYYALDYTNGGKIAGFGRDHNCMDQIIGFDELHTGGWRIQLTTSETAHFIPR
jgi:polysaccharide pyruvyl transferase WcaK-like protein